MPDAVLVAAGSSPVSVDAAEGVVPSSSVSVRDGMAGVEFSSSSSPPVACRRRDRRGAAWTCIVGAGVDVRTVVPGRARVVRNGLEAHPPPPGSSIGHVLMLIHFRHLPGSHAVHTRRAATHAQNLSRFVEQVPYLEHLQHGIGSECSRRRRLRGRGVAEEASSSRSRTASLAKRACTPLSTPNSTDSSVGIVIFVGRGIFLRVADDGITTMLPPLLGQRRQS